ncbi:MAG: DNA replication/repair protein RecF [Chloroflexi bacterium]|nr:DNA replication/repair protein RecF [Chloroflexota bacterium]MBI3733923.1 DNA replication/repair protein RecF [Chloroflexota bacterium]
MRLTHLSITNFKNYARLELDLPAGTTIVHGDNAQGKTSFLEAIFYLATTRALGSQTDAQLINWVAQQSGLPYARLWAQAQPAASGATDRAPKQLEIIWSQDPSPGGASADGAARLQKSLKLNGVRKRALDWVGQLAVVLFVPADLELVTGPPSQRRHYLDHLISQIDVKYLEALHIYTRVLLQRNQHLKRLQERGGPAESLHLWDDQLVTHGTYLVLRRQAVMTQLDELAQRVHPQLTGGRERLRLLYRPNLNVGQPVDYQLPLTLGADFSATYHQPQLDGGEVAAHFYARLRDGEPRERAQGITLAGPHRDDLRFLVDGVDMNIYGSRGQQRSTALALKLAEMELMHAQTGEHPILLLDDVLSELDAERRRYLVGRIDAHEQTLLTTTDLTQYACQFTRPVCVMRVREGIMRRDEAREREIVRDLTSSPLSPDQVGGEGLG